jgi:hypothetical protein
MMVGWQRLLTVVMAAVFAVNGGGVFAEGGSGLAEGGLLKVAVALLTKVVDFAVGRGGGWLWLSLQELWR